MIIFCCLAILPLFKCNCEIQGQYAVSYFLTSNVHEHLLLHCGCHGETNRNIMTIEHKHECKTKTSQLISNKGS